MKKVFISYKQSGVSKKELKNNLNFLRDNIEKLGYKTLIYYFDEDSSLAPEIMDKIFLKNIKSSDIFISFLNYKEKSEGQLMELGMAYSLGKRMILLVNNQVKENYYLVYGTTQEIYYFDELKNLDFKKILG